MPRAREFDLRSREIEDEVIQTIKDICEKAYQKRRMTAADADLIVDEAENSIGRIMNAFDDFANGEDYVDDRDLDEFCLIAVNQIIKALSRETRDRDRGSRAGRDRGRSRGRENPRMRFADDRRDDRGGRGSGFAISGGSTRNDERAIKNTPSKTRAQVAEEASKRQRQEEREIGQGKVNNNTSTPRPQPLNKVPQRLPQGIDYNDDYAIVGKLGDECPIAIGNLDIPPSPSKIYNNLQNLNILVDNAITVNSRELEIHLGFGNVANMINFVRENDHLLFSPDDYCHILHFPKVSLAKIAGLGEELFMAGAEVKKILNDTTKKNAEMMEILSDIAAMLNQVNPKVRSAIMNRVLRRWNVVSRAIFCIPEAPNEYLEAASWEHLLRFCAPTTSTSTDPVLLKLREKVDYFAERKGKQFGMKLHGVMQDVLNDLYDINNGFIDVRKEHLEYITGWDELPICIDQQYRPRDICKMNEDQRKALAAQFMKNYCCIVEAMTVIVTNLNTTDLTVHPQCNHIAAIDIPTVQVLRNMMNSSTHHNLLYTTTNGGNNLTYIGHCGNSFDSTVQLTTLKDSY